MGQLGIGPVLGAGDDLLGLLGIAVGVFEHTQGEHFGQGTGNGAVNGLVVQGDHVRREALGQLMGALTVLMVNCG